MKTSLRKLRGFTALHRHGEHKDRRDLRSLSQLDELAQASQDMEDMRSCYDSLLSAAAATANSAYEFSESLREMGACLLEKTALNDDDEESGRVLLMLGKVQFELQKLVDRYRSHIFQTITSPSESLLNELQTVEEMKLQCDQKRYIYEDMIMRQREKGRGRNGKVEGLSMQQLQAAYDEFDEEAALFIFRLKSLKKGQSHSLLTQAARHHAAQLWFFKKALKSLEALEPHLKFVTEQQHIDYHFSGLEDDYMDEHDEDDGGSDEALDDGELSFDYGSNDQDHVAFVSRKSMELDAVEVDLTFPQVATLEAPKENLVRNHRKSFSSTGEIRHVSQSAPLFPGRKSDPSEGMAQMRPFSSRKFNTYVLPTPVDAKNSDSAGSGSPLPRTLKTSLSGRTNNLWHSSPLQPKKYEKERDEKYSGSIFKNPQSILKESNNNTAPTRFPPPLADGLLFSRLEPPVASDSKKLKRYAFSGPIASKPWPSQTVSVARPQLLSGPLLQNSKGHLSSPTLSPKVSPKASPNASPTFVSSPKISELHELPRPPIVSNPKSSRPLGSYGHSAPLGRKDPVLPSTIKSSVSKSASPLPTPSQVVTRSFSIPSSGLRAMALNATHNPEVASDIASPPLTPISLPNIQPLPIGSTIVNQTVDIRGAD